jgi:hypothetical protein
MAFGLWFLDFGLGFILSKVSSVDTTYLKDSQGTSLR